MESTNDRRFRHKILSLTAAMPGWEVVVTHDEILKPRERRVEGQYVFPVVAWAVIDRQYENGGQATEIDPVFCADGRPVTATEYQRQWSRLEPREGKTGMGIGVEVQAVE